MKSRPIEKKEKLNLSTTNSLFARHWLEFTGGGCGLVGVYPIGPLLVLAHLVLSPVTATIYGGVRTIIDASTRKPLSNKALEEAYNHLENCSLEEFDKFINVISSYSPVSSSSYNLLKKLSKCSKQADTELTSKVQEEEKRLISLKKQEKLFIIKNEISNSSQVTITESNIELDENEMNEIQKALSNYSKELSQTINQNRREAQLGSIHEYLKDTINHGARLENLIVEKSSNLLSL
ncbi:MAG: hypothetical protein HYX60_08300 [Legionella longbeachae]|nr:hypothetical protein [Legionella longbeachae]